jgi:capsular exopolysaccharide synthesis family protein
LGFNLKRNKKINNNRKLITSVDPKSPISEQYRSIRTNIQFSAVDRTVKSILVTSAGPGEGKSTSAANIAVVFAQQEKRVLLVDADMRKPTVHYTFQLSNHSGLTSVLTRKNSLEEAVKNTDIPHLSVLTSGPIPPNPAELLGSRAMEQLMNEVKGDFDIVIFDTPPTLAVADSQILANLCDGILLVLFSGKTGTEESVKAKELLLTAKGKILGAVLNHKKIKKSESYYYYGN